MHSTLDNPELTYAERLAAICERLHTGPDIVAAARLWPRFEAGSIDAGSVARSDGPAVAELLVVVAAIVEVERAANPADRSEENLRKLLLTIASDARAVVIRLAVQLDRMQRSPDADLAVETRTIWVPLANRLGIWALKWELEDRAFRELEPDAYREVATRVERTRAEREALVADAVAALAAGLERAGIRGATIDGRPKHLYSIWRKMRRKGVGPERIFDLYALRVLVDDEAACYAALGVVQSLWTAIPGEFDDYIAAPKANDYRSLHVAVTGPGGRPLEVQIRTPAMHESAESGVASHWRYKERVRFDRSFEQRLAWLRGLLEPGQTVEPDAFDRLREQLMAERVYALTPEGRIIDLPAGATVLDFAYYVHTGLGHRCRGARMDGRIVPLTTPVRSGAKIEILTTRDGKPSRDWLAPRAGYLKTTRARAKARAWFRRTDGEPAATEPTKAVTPPPAGIVRSLRPPTRREADDVVSIDGVGGLMTQLARCCRPLPGDAIAGYVTRGRGVSIHRADCHNLKRLRETDAERVHEVAWGRAAKSGGFPVDIEVTARDRDGLLAEISGALSGEKVPIHSVDARVERATALARLRLTIGITDAAQLGRTLAKIGKLPDIQVVRRV